MSEEMKPFDGVAVHFSNALNNRPEEFELRDSVVKACSIEIIHKTTQLKAVLKGDSSLHGFLFRDANLQSQISEDVLGELHDAVCSWLGAEFVTAMANNNAVPCKTIPVGDTQLSSNQKAHIDMLLGMSAVPREKERALQQGLQTLSPGFYAGGLTGNITSSGG